MSITWLQIWNSKIPFCLNQLFQNTICPLYKYNGLILKYIPFSKTKTNKNAFKCFLKVNVEMWNYKRSEITLYCTMRKGEVSVRAWGYVNTLTLRNAWHHVSNRKWSPQTISQFGNCKLELVILWNQVIISNRGIALI